MPQSISNLGGEMSPADADQWGRRNSTGVVIASSMTFESVCYQKGGKQILDGVSLKLNPGKVLCLLGPSGSGKTSLLRIAAGLYKADSGKVMIDNRTVCDGNTFVEPEKRGVGMVFQDYALFPHLTIQQNVEFGLTALSQAETKQQATRILERVGLADRAGEYPHVLSGGEQQRVALARALAPRPGILLMDEPFSGLDSRLRDTVREKTMELLRETRSTTVIVTHDPEEALRVSDSIALIRDGKLVQHGTAHELYYKPVDLFSASFFSEVNVIDGQALDKTIESPLGKLENKGNLSGKVSVAIRHTDIELVPFSKKRKEPIGRISGRRFAGQSELIDLVVDGINHPIYIRTSAGNIAPDDEFVNLIPNRDRILVFEG